MSEYPSSMLNWLSETWKVWLVFTILALASWTLYWYLFGQRAYRAINSKAQIRHGRLGSWIDLEEHLEGQHGIKKEVK